MAASEVYRYPYTSFTDKTDYLQISIVDYVPIGNRGTSIGINTTSFTGTSLVGTPGQRRNTNKNSKKVILLPIPSNISDTNGSVFGDSSLNSIAGAAAAGVLNTMGAGSQFFKDGKLDLDGGTNAATAALGNALNNAKSAAGGLPGIQGFATRFFASSALSSLNVNLTPDQILARTTGEILNPNLELLFSGPTLRTFRFSFKLTPRNDTEAKQIKKIIRCLKINSAPKVGSNIAEINEEGARNTFLRTPSVFELTYKQGNRPHDFLHKFKQCFLENITVNYTADGVYSTYEDGTPVAMIMSLTFKEIEPIYDIDYDDSSAGIGVGY